MDDLRRPRCPGVPPPAAGRPFATAVSEVAWSDRAARATAGRMARLSLGLGALAMSTTGCLITDTPQFTPQTHTAPFLVAATADPDSRTIVIVDNDTLAVTFAADVISQDDPPDSTGQFQEVNSRLYLDYGIPGGGGLPFPYYPIPGGMVNAGTLAQTTGRRISATWQPPERDVPLGCHTATLIVSHIFDEQSGCPVCIDDFSTITWQVLRCDSSMPGNCDELPITGAGACQAPTTNCATAESESDAGSSCPDLSDGGAM
jgi:hypothetical protein